ncbi:phosphoribosyltransferase [Phytoactinopolyspora endophytica]|uniref:phosphoribosyltransferase n=1 Tax=Phytoactinopolyspora endophytica TaxID=1642495 RepID=UPI0013EB3CEA|nr:phosphoribosyltransferase family protein [Phytoactinopolyspora endophytica]
MNLTRGPWRDRADAGRELAEAVRGALAAPGGRELVPVVLGLPRGGVVVASEVATALGADLDVLVVRKVGVPWHRELALGAVTASGVRVHNAEVFRQAHLSEHDMEAAFATAEREAGEREQWFRAGRPAVAVGGRRAIVVDDGIATGATTLAAVQLLRNMDPPPALVMLAVPVAPRETVNRLASHVDTLVVLHGPVNFAAVGEWFLDFTQVSDAEVQQIMEGAR